MCEQWPYTREVDREAAVKLIDDQCTTGPWPAPECNAWLLHFIVDIKAAVIVMDATGMQLSIQPPAQLLPHLHYW